MASINEKYRYRGWKHLFTYSHQRRPTKTAIKQHFALVSVQCTYILQPTTIFSASPSDSLIQYKLSCTVTAVRGIKDSVA